MCMAVLEYVIMEFLLFKSKNESLHVALRRRCDNSNQSRGGEASGQLPSGVLSRSSGKPGEQGNEQWWFPRHA